jgi:transcriptional regulator GlxA family with amidase domain
MCFAGLHRLDSIDACDLLCVPGGFGTVAALDDAAYLNSLRRLGANARYVTSVCTGSLLLAAAGLLRGKRAACHWAWRDKLADFGVVPDAARVVRDGNVFTGGGVTAGIDLALEVMAEVAGRDYAETVQLAIEYAPAPPFDYSAALCTRFSCETFDQSMRRVAIIRIASTPNSSSEPMSSE